VTDALDRLTAALADRYTIERELGAGGMARVYLAEDRKLGRAVALKVLRPELAAALGGDRFLREIEIAAKLAHPHILALHDCGEANGLLYYTMPFVQGESLRDRLTREQQLPLDEALQITREVADALGYAHSLGLVHRDIKPENILFQAGHAVVSDFGIARAVSAAGTARLTETGLAIGTPAYMSPEQAAGSQSVDGRSDLYSLGCVLYEMLSGETPYTGPTPQAILAKKLSEPLPRISVVREAVPAGIEAALSKALARTPADRWVTAAQFAAALSHPEAVTTPSGGTGPTDGWRVMAPRRWRRWEKWMVGAATVAIVATVGTQLPFLERGRGSAPSLDPNLIAVFPFRVTSTDSSLKELGQQLPDLLWSRLTGEFGPRTTDPAYAIRQWEAKGGTARTPLPEARQLEIARAVGAGRLLVGSVTGTVARVSLTGSLFDVRSGSVRVVPRSVEGPYDSFPGLVDRLTNQLLAEEYGDAVHRLPDLAGHPTAAVQAYLRGLLEYRRTPLTPENAERIQSLFARALELDSTLVVAALSQFEVGENNMRAVRYAWGHQSALSPRDRALLHAVAGTWFAIHGSTAERLASFDSLVYLAPQWALAADEQSRSLQRWGAAVGMEDWRGQAKAASRRAAELDPDAPGPAVQLFDLALTEGDTAEARRQSTALTRMAAGVGGWAAAWTTRLRLALAVADTALAARLWAEGEESLAAHRDSAEVFLMPLHGGLVVDGRGLRELDHFVALAGTPIQASGSLERTWARERGRYRRWQSLRDAWLSTGDPWSALVERLSDALFFSEPDDSTVVAAAASLEEDARRAADSIRAGAFWGWRVRRAVDLCRTTLWRLSHGQTAGARQVQRELMQTRVPDFLGRGQPSPVRAGVCAGLIGALLAEREGGDVRAAALRLDSIVRPGPGSAERLTLQEGNLAVAALLARHGEPVRALAAVRRACPWESWRVNNDDGLIVPCLRLEGRLAALTGDRAGAVRVYERYLALREDPEPPWRAQRDSVVAELAALKPRR
jgi:serine/threonine-protein kinase